MVIKKRVGTRLTDAGLRKLKANDPICTDAVVKGLMLRSSQRVPGVGSWIIRYYDPTNKLKRVKLTIGKYPAMSLEEARSLAKQLLSGVSVGLDPKVTLQELKKQQQQALIFTFEAVAIKYHEKNFKNKAWKNQRYAEQWIREMKNHIFPKIGKIPISKIIATDIVSTLNDVWQRIPDTAKKLYNRLHQVFVYAEATGLCNHNPCPAAKVVLGKQRKKNKAERRLPSMPWQDLPCFVEEILLAGSPTPSKRALLFIILNAARSGAVRNLSFEEIDFQDGIWTMAADAVERKTSVNRYYPLSRQSLLLLKIQLMESELSDRIDTLVFPSLKVNSKGNRLLSDMTLTAVLRRQQERFSSDIQGRTPTVHGFRTSFKGWATVQGYEDKWSELQLAHEIGNQVQQAYDRENLIEQRRGMMQQWADFVLPWPRATEYFGI